MKTYNSPPLIFLFFLFSFSSYSQSISNEVLMEDSILQFELNYDLTQKVIDSTSANNLDPENKVLFKQFFKIKKHQIFLANYQGMLTNRINSSMLQGIYDDEFNTIKNDSTLLIQFENWKHRRTHTHNHPHHNREAVVDCHNIDFEKGTLDNWTPSMGDVPCPAPGFQGCVNNIVAGSMGVGATARHLIVTNGNDPDIPAVSRVGSGGYSLRLGDERNGANSDIIKHEFKVDSSNKFYIYEFAVVFQEPPGHPLLSQPFFSIEFYDSNMNLIPTCGNYFVSNASGNPGFIDVTNAAGAVRWRYKPWSKIAVDLENYIKHKITVVYTVADCAAGGHEARAYIDGRCEKPDIKVSRTCKSIELEADSGYIAYQWFQGKNRTLMINDTNRVLDSVGPGIYSVDIISESGCTLRLDTTINEIYITLEQELVELNPSCNNTTDGKITVNGYGGTPSYQYSIDNGLTFQASNEFNGLGIGNYTLIIKDDSTCYDTVDLVLLGPPPIIPNLVVDDPSCHGECTGSATVNPIGGVSAMGNYRVEFNGVIAINNNVKNLCAGMYTVKITDDEGCSQLQPFVINDPAPEVIDDVIVANEKCFNACDGSITIIDASATSYSIDDGLTFQANNIFNNLCAQAGPYQIAISTAEGCIARKTEVITQPPPLSINPIRDSFICLNKYATLTAIPVGGTPPYVINWSNGTTGPSMTESPKISTPYTATVTDLNGCTYIEEFNINLHPQPIANFTFNPGPVTDVFNTKINFTNTTEYGAPLTYEWNISNLTTFATKDALYEFPSNGGKQFINCLKVENQQGCRDSICKELYIKHEVLVYVPNTFTPNQDNTNDIFQPIVEGLKTEHYKFYIFNRWGELIFSTGSQTEGWDGKFKGQKVQEGAYVWKIKGVTKETSESYENIGHVTVLNKL